MKFKLYQELLNENEILSHVFLTCIEKGQIEEIVEKNGGLTDEEIQNREIEIELKIDGKECNPKKFFDLLANQYNFYVECEATKIVKEQTSEKLVEMENEIDSIRQIISSWADGIRWDVPNKFIKK